MKTQHTKLAYWLALQFAPGISAKQFNVIKQFCPDFEEIFSSSRADLLSLGLAEESVNAIRTPDWRLVDQHLTWGEAQGHYIISLDCPHYPEQLKQIASPPLSLFAKGDVSLLKKQQLAIVGSRHPTPHGKDNAYQFAQHFGQQDWVITSGLALGIDGIAHQAALDQGKPTIAVLGTGVDVVYPKAHHSMAKKVIDHGLLLSEFPLGSNAQKAHFPRRNRIISGLSLGVLVVEAAVRSGSLITARFANEQNREVFAIPGSIHNPLARGCHQLIKQGAKLVESADDIFSELTSQQAQPIEFKEEKKTGLAKDYADMLQCIDFAPTSVDTIIEKTGLTAKEVSSMLLVLELKGFISARDGAYYRQ